MAYWVKRRQGSGSTLSDRRLLIALLAVVIACTSCDRTGKPGVWASVDGVPITRAEVEAVYRARAGALPDKSKPELALSFKLSILNELVDRTLLLKRASELRIAVSNAEVETRLAEMRNPDSAASFARKLRAQGTTPSQFREDVRDNLILQRLIQREVVSRVHVTAEQIAAYYSRNQADFDVPAAEYHLAQILVTPTPDPSVRNLMHDDARNELEAQHKIRALYLQLRSGKAFAQVAQEYSEDPRTAPGGGDMGFVPVESLAGEPALRRALRSLKPGQITGIIRDRTGFRIVKLLGRVSAGRRPLSDPGVQDSIRKTLANEQLEVLKAAYIETLRNRAHVIDYLAQEIMTNPGSAQAIQ